MPCYVDPSYIESSERDQNERLLGKRWTDKEAAINVACAYAARVRHGAPLPEWAIKWADLHEERDMAASEWARKYEHDRTLKESADVIESGLPTVNWNDRDGSIQIETREVEE